jgi:hypothetical protein
MTPSIAAGRAGKARMSEHKDVRVRAGARLARSAGQSSQPEVGETVVPGANGFGYFPRKESNPRRGTARKKTWMSNGASTGFRSRWCGFLNDEQKQSRAGALLHRPIKFHMPVVELRIVQ